MHAVEGQELQASEQAENLKKAAYAAKVFSGKFYLKQKEIVNQGRPIFFCDEVIKKSH